MTVNNTLAATWGLTVPCLNRFSEYVTWADPTSSPGNQIALFSLFADLGRYIHGGTTKPYNSNSLSLESFRSSINVTVEDLSLETFHSLKRRYVWFSVLPGTHEKSIIYLLLALSAISDICDLPLIAFQLVARHDFCVQSHVLLDSEVVCIFVDVLQGKLMTVVIRVS